MSHKKKNPPVGPHDVKAAIIRKHGTIAAFIREHGKSAGTVYAAIKNRRNGPKSTAIRDLALQ